MFVVVDFKKNVCFCWFNKILFFFCGNNGNWKEGILKNKILIYIWLIKMIMYINYVKVMYIDNEVIIFDGYMWVVYYVFLVLWKGELIFFLC